VVAELELGELPRHRLGDDATPEPRGGEDVGLVQAPHFARFAIFVGVGGAESEGGGEAGDTFDFLARVWFAVFGPLVGALGGWVGFFAITKIDTAGEFADDEEVGACADFFLEGADLGEGRGGEGARPEVAEGVELFAEFEETLFWAGGAGAVFGAADGAEEDGVGRFGGAEG
jgi:hypothetical protein